MELSKILVVGLGNPILGDDGVGWAVADEVRRLESGAQVDVECVALGGLHLMERMIGYTHAIVVDAFTSHTRPPGALYTFLLQDMPDLTAGHTSSAHDTSLQNALNLGRRMGLPLPHEVYVVGVEAHQVFEFSERLTTAVQNAVPGAVDRVRRLLTSLRMNDSENLARFSAAPWSG